VVFNTLWPNANADTFSWPYLSDRARIRYRLFRDHWQLQARESHSGCADCVGHGGKSHRAEHPCAGRFAKLKFRLAPTNWIIVQTYTMYIRPVSDHDCAKNSGWPDICSCDVQLAWKCRNIHLAFADMTAIDQEHPV
jgi:hypothetical protein